MKYFMRFSVLVIAVLLSTVFSTQVMVAQAAWSNLVRTGDNFAFFAPVKIGNGKFLIAGNNLSLIHI